MTKKVLKRRLRKKEAKKVAEEVSRRAGVEIPSGTMDLVEFGDVNVILLNNEPVILEYEGKYYLTVYGAIKFAPERYKVTVDEGAIKFIMNGADVMKPGIVFADDRIKAGDFVFVTVEGKRSPIAVGIALCDGVEMVGGKGKAVKNVNHVKDRIWKFFFMAG